MNKKIDFGLLRSTKKLADKLSAWRLLNTEFPEQFNLQTDQTWLGTISKNNCYIPRLEWGTIRTTTRCLPP